jgi:hypothetical protein
MKTFFIFLLLLTASCNPISRMKRVQSQINDLTDAVNNSRNIISKDSVIYSPSRIDSVFTQTKDSITNTVTNNKFYYSHDTTKIIIQDVALLTSARRTADLATGKLEGFKESTTKTDKQIKILFIVCMIEAVLIGIGVYILFQLLKTKL